MNISIIKTGFLLVVALMLQISLSSCTGRTNPGSTVEDDPDILYKDDFSAESVGNWLTEADEQGSTQAGEGVLLVDVKAANTLQYAVLEEMEFSDFNMEVDATMLEGGNESTYGILIRVQDQGKFYRFEVMSDGHYMIEQSLGDGSWDRFLADWQPSEAIHQGINATNRFRVEADGPSMTFYVNEQRIGEITDNTLTAGRIALDAGTFGHPKTRVAFDNLILTRTQLADE